MTARSIDGKAVAADIRKDTEAELAALAGPPPRLAVVLVGDDPASRLYVGLKQKACERLGIDFELHELPEQADLAEVLSTVTRLDRDDAVDAILVQLPLPAHLNDDEVIDAIDPDKDVDGFHPKTVDALLAGKTVVAPGLAAGIMSLVHAAELDLDGKRMLIIANSETFARPLSYLAGKEGAFTAYARPDAPDLVESAGGSDIVVIAVGHAGFLKGSMLKPGAIVIDVGTNREGTKVVGDAAPSVWDVASHVTPVPGGVGPVTVAMLLRNTVALAKKRRREKGAKA